MGAAHQKDQAVMLGIFSSHLLPLFSRRGEMLECELTIDPVYVMKPSSNS